MYLPSNNFQLETVQNSRGGNSSLWRNISPSSFVSCQLQFRESLVITVPPRPDFFCFAGKGGNKNDWSSYHQCFFLYVLFVTSTTFFTYFLVKLHICWTIPTNEIRPNFSDFVGCQKTSEYLTTFSIWDLFVCNPIVIGDIVGWLAPDFHLTTSHKLWLGRSHEFLLRGFLMEFLLDSKLLIQRSQDKDFFQPVCYRYTYVFTWIYIYI